jgi:hypothetical protein
MIERSLPKKFTYSSIQSFLNPNRYFVSNNIYRRTTVKTALTKVSLSPKNKRAHFQLDSLFYTLSKTKSQSQGLSFLPCNDKSKYLIENLKNLHLIMTA